MILFIIVVCVVYMAVHTPKDHRCNSSCACRCHR